MGFSAYLQSRPEEKNVQIYHEIKAYSPYYLDKRLGGLRIMSKTDKDFKEQPDNVEVFHRLDSLEKEWGKSHLKIENSQLRIVDDINNTLVTLPIKTQNELYFLHHFYGI